MRVCESFADMRRGRRVAILEDGSTPWQGSGNRMSACYGRSVSSASGNSGSSPECGRPSSQIAAGRLGQRPGPSQRPPDVVAVVLMWNNLPETLERVAPLERWDYTNFAVWVGDNDSRDVFDVSEDRSTEVGQLTYGSGGP